MDEQRPSPDPIQLSIPFHRLDSPLTVATTVELSEGEKPFYIEVPHLPSSKRDLYGPVPDTFRRGVDFNRDDLEAVVGEWRDGRTLYYYVRFVDGTAHKLRALTFKALYGDLVAEYERRKMVGSLDPFDPSSSAVHQQSRIKHIVTINGSRATLKTFSGSPESNFLTSDSELSPLTDDLDRSDDEDYVRESLQRRPMTRSSKSMKQSKLPFSPKKLRNRRMLSDVPSDLDDDLGGYGQSDVEGEPITTRRSTRTRKSAHSNLDDNSLEDGVEDTDDKESHQGMVHKSAKSGKKRQQRRPAGSRPVYGHFRDIDDLDVDPYDEEATEPLRAHRDVCEKCHKDPAHMLLTAARKPKRGRQKRTADVDEDLEGGEEERIQNMGGWVRCLKCPVAAHWRCLARTQRDEITRAACSRDKEEWKARHEQSSLDGRHVPSELPDRRNLNIDQTTEFICGLCMKGGRCMGCGEVALEPDASTFRQLPTQDPTDLKSDSAQLIGITPEGHEHTSEISPPNDGVFKLPRELLFRCLSCKRLAHYGHLSFPHNETPDASDAERALYYQVENGWECADCASFVYPLDKILAWRPYPPDAVEPKSPDPPDIKTSLPREYLVKWTGRSYRRIQWVPHMWLVSTYIAKLKHFLDTGPKVELLEEPVVTVDGMEIDRDEPGPQAITFESADNADNIVQRRIKAEMSSPQPLKDAQLRIPLAWKTVDRILDVQLWHPPTGPKGRSQKKLALVNDGDDEDKNAISQGLQSQLDRAFEDGEQPDDALLESVDEWETRTKQKLEMKHINQVIWAFIKWEDLGYEEATWDSPPRPGEPGYPAFEAAFSSFLKSRTVFVVKSRKDIDKFENRTPGGYGRHVIDSATDQQPELGQSSRLRLMKFQIDGLNWLCDNWWIHQPCILADEMGLGKTVQIVTFLGMVIGKFKAAPALVVVPNSTITNWVREFSRWAPMLRVVPYHGEAKSREVVIKYELFHGPTKRREPKYHVLVTTYETVTNSRDFSLVFKNMPRWEVLVVDEGQRLKGDNSLLFRKLNELNVMHRVIMTGTPLNNNIRELFNLMNFLDPDQWTDLERLAKEYEELNEDLVRQLHTRLKPYFLRRIKSDVLQLPPKNEVIVPVSMTPLQKEIYRSILSQNLDILRTLTHSSAAMVQGCHLAMKANMKNMLMQLRKCLQHPYLISNNIEPSDLDPLDAHERLISASAKLRLLKSLLPKLKARGHRVLLFSQFVIALDIVEDFLTGEGYKYLRLDGGTKQSVRQKGMDEFNKPDSDVFIYILTTRAGGVGINLYTADTVIIFDPDFNPHQDLQAISRSHRYGQQKTCLVFKLMVKDSSEERIMQAGKKKLVLDHLIVQKMDDDENGGDDLQSILTYGAKAVFEEGQNSRDIVYTDLDLDKLIEKTEIEGENDEVAKESGLKFSFAKVWAADKDTFEDIGEDAQDISQDDSWAQALERLAATKNTTQQEEVMGRGVRRKAAATFPQQELGYIDGLEDTPHARKSKSKKHRLSKSGTSTDSDAYAASPHADDSDFSMGDMDLEPDPLLQSKKRDVYQRENNTQIPTESQEDDIRCGLCDKVHGPRACAMTDDSTNLVEYRKILILSNDEPVETRKAAIDAIDQELLRRRQLHLILDQSRKPVKKTQTTGRSEQGEQRNFQVNKYRLAVVPSSVPINDKAIRSPQFIQTTGQPAAPNLDRKDKGKGLDIPPVLSRPALPAKRKPSPQPEATSSKKLKGRVCPLCGSSSWHKVKVCPLVVGGSMER
ncbi:hypothetical protein J3A83DRAFT_4245468 [Scleroderma citrinum]